MYAIGAYLHAFSAPYTITGPVEAIFSNGIPES
jgi:hypothetical protein